MENQHRKIAGYRELTGAELADIAELKKIEASLCEMCDDLAARTGWSVGSFEPFPGRDLPNEGEPDAGPARFAVLPELSDDRLLGDVYVQLNDLFQARATLQSVIDNCREPDLVAEARQRLDTINASQAPREKSKAEGDEITIPLPGGTNGQ